MSQAKVDRYKEEKRNRAKIMAKEKRNRRIAQICSGVIAAAIVGWAGFSVYDTITRKPEDTTAQTEVRESFVVDTGALDDYLATLD